jgi:hypothetical protein
MTCSQMFEKVQDIRRAAYWATRGHAFDPNLLTGKEMDQKVRDIERAEYWKAERGYAFDANSMTAQEIDQKAKELDTAAFWERSGCYYDPNSQKVFLDEGMHTELSTLAGLHGSHQGGDPPGQGISRGRDSTGFLKPAPTSQTLSSAGGTYPNLGDGHWVKKKMDRGRFVMLEDRSLWRIGPTDRIDSRLWLSLEEIVVTNSGNPRYPYRLVNTDSSNAVAARFVSRNNTHWISENIDSGQFLKLQDDSLWEVSPLGTLDCALWLPLSGIVVTESENPTCPYLLINMDDGEAVEAKRLK